ncbi:MGMT family protein [Glycomyces sp. TRM65418]|uniref:MGMT family protein n=1 Tax=Glycomyces sp. TRM65418 TaxID=2867006 RepID=UPI001CE607C5|nr:MGMT family protein [Glycomyces sp. TRM65418]MCC3761644.1 MGMT family protein [Glycomyces sp. TRM65418]QZD55738.1 MGMT family protein [Glycomyces sp. TRM65418]
MTTERDWELVRRVVDALPEGTWTSYGDLAELIGTGPRQVGAFMRDDGGVPKAYRVLTAGGTVSEGYRWADGRSGRDVPDLLRADGVVVTGKGRADQAQRMSVYDLRLLAAELEADANETASDDSHGGLYPINRDISGLRDP